MTRPPGSDRSSANVTLSPIHARSRGATVDQFCCRRLGGAESTCRPASARGIGGQLNYVLRYLPYHTMRACADRRSALRGQAFGAFGPSQGTGLCGASEPAAARRPRPRSHVHGEWLNGTPGPPPGMLSGPSRTCHSTLPSPHVSAVHPVRGRVGRTTTHCRLSFNPSGIRTTIINISQITRSGRSRCRRTRPWAV